MGKELNLNDSQNEISLPQVIRAAEGYLSCITRLISDKPTKDSESSKMAAGFFVSMASKYSAILYMAKSEHVSQIPILLRSMFEALADLKNIVNCEGYLDQIIFNDATEMKSMVISALKQREVIGEEVVFELEMIKTEAEKRIKQAQSVLGENVSKMSTAKKIENAGLEHAYSIYKSLCGFSHNQITAIAMQYIGDDGFLNLNPPPSGLAVAVIGQANLYFEMACHTIPDFMDISEEEVFSSIAAAKVVWNIAREQPM
ncbi:DUF5677 domain-containing protein [Chromobacterium violaceum]|uniref:DUF5677 domain-containing protein n=1 Tax=Chromobacterium violaceum TaxID=536 RepID=UPI0012D3626E|nr:DUF5677 domain-containing protein [Chromobacterium violaceum]